jgi:hypothetical protein
LMLGNFGKTFQSVHRRWETLRDDQQWTWRPQTTHSTKGKCYQSDCMDNKKHETIIQISGKMFET